MGIGENIKKYRGAMTQEDLVDKLGITTVTLSRWENNQTTPNSKKLKQLAEILGVTPEQILNVQNPQIKEINEHERSLKEDHGVMRYKFNDTEVLELPATPEFMPMFERIISERLKIRDMKTVSA